MRTGSAICLGLTALGMATVVGVPTALAVRCHKHPDGTKALAQDSNAAANAEMPCPYELRENGDVIGGILYRNKQGHIFPNGTVLDDDGFFKGVAKEDGSIFLAYPGIDNIDSFLNANDCSNSSSDGSIGVRATGVVDANGDVWRNTDATYKNGKWSTSNDHTNPKKVAHLDSKSDKTTKLEKNAMGIFFLA